MIIKVLSNYSFDGTTYTLDYYWDYSYNGFATLGGLQVKEYHLHLTGTVVPIPAAVWLFGTGFIALVGLARRKRV